MFSHDAYMSTLISRGDLMTPPGVTISMHAIEVLNPSSVQSEVNIYLASKTMTAIISWFFVYQEQWGYGPIKCFGVPIAAHPSLVAKSL